MDDETQRHIDEIVEKAVAEIQAAELEDSKKSFSECIERNEAGAVMGAYCNGTIVTPGDLRSFGKDNPVRLWLRKCRVTDDLISTCADLKSLDELCLWGSDVTDSQMKFILRMSNLKKLDLRYTAISDDGLLSIGRMNQLVSLDLSGTDVTSQGMNSLRGLKKLKELSLDKTQVDDAGMAAISSLNSLEKLSLEDGSISNRGLEHIGHLSELKLLSIHNMETVNEDGLRHLEGLKELETLYLCVPVTAKGVSSLKKMTGLKHLYMGDVTSDTPFNNERLMLELPSVGVY